MSDSIVSSALPAQDRPLTGHASDPDGGLRSDRRPPPDPPIRLFPPRPTGWIKAFSIGFGLASVAVWVSQSAAHSAATEMPTALAASLAAMVLLYHIGYLVAPFLVGRGTWPSFLGALTLAPAAHGWVLVYGQWLGVVPTPVAAVAAGCLAAQVLLWVIALRQLIGALMRPRTPAASERGTPEQD